MVLLEDVVFTGERALTGVQTLAEHGAEVLGVVCLLDRDFGASRVSRRVSASWPLFTESDLLTMAHGAGT